MFEPAIRLYIEMMEVGAALFEGWAGCLALHGVVFQFFSLGHCGSVSSCFFFLALDNSNSESRYEFS